MVTRSPPPFKPAVEAKNLLGGAVEQPLAVMPITVWNLPSKSARPPPRRVEELKRKNPESKVGEDEDSLLFNAVEAKNLLGGAVEQPLAVMPITVWNLPSKSARPPPRRVEELKRKNPESKVGEDEDSLLFNVELAAGAISSVLKDSYLRRSKALPVDEALTLSLQGVALVTPCV